MSSPNRWWGAGLVERRLPISTSADQFRAWNRAIRDLNGFLYDTDPDGLSCPIGAHIRRANPRTGDAPGGRQGPLDNLLVMLGLTVRRIRGATSSTLPWPRNTTVWPFLRSEDDAIASARFHRILRRGREYGEQIDRNSALDPATPDPQAGIHFLCLNANIARQFEFVQGAWIASAKFAALTGEQDPLLGNREPFPNSPDCQAAAHRRFFPARRPTPVPARDGASAIRQRSRRRLFLPAGPSRAQVDRQRLSRHRTAHRRSARRGSRHSFSDETSPAHHTCACGRGSDCRAADDPADNARD